MAPDRTLAEVRAELEGRTRGRPWASRWRSAGRIRGRHRPDDALVAVLIDGGRVDSIGDWVVGGTSTEARRRAGKVQGRRTSEPPRWPIDLPEGEWVRLQTTWVEPAYLEPDASWCVPGGEPASSLGNGGAFGGQASTPLGAVARQLADKYGEAVRCPAHARGRRAAGPETPADGGRHPCRRSGMHPGGLHDRASPPRSAAFPRRGRGG